MGGRRTQAAPKLKSGGSGAAPLPDFAPTTMDWLAVIHWHRLTPVGPTPCPGQFPELPAIMRMLWYFPAEMLATVSLWWKELPTGSHMLD